MRSLSLWVYMCWLFYVWKALFHWCLLSSLTLIIFLLPVPQGSLSPEVGSLLETAHLGLNVPRPLSLSIAHLCVSVFVPIYWKWKLLWWWVIKTLIYVYRRMLLGVITLLQSFHRAAVFGFLQGPWPISLQVLGHLYSVNHEFHSVEWGLNPTR